MRGLLRNSVVLGAIVAAGVLTYENTATGSGDDAPMLTDRDLTRATAEASVVTSIRSLSLDAPTASTLAKVPSRSSLGRSAGSVDGAGASTPSLFGRGKKPDLGRIAYVDQRKKFFFFGRTIYTIRLATVGKLPIPGRVIYKGDREIDSVAVSEDGELVTFSAKTEAGDFDVFVLDVKGKLFGGRGEVVALPRTDFDETDVSMSLDGVTHAWRSFDEVTGTTNHVVAQLNRETGELTATTFNITLGGNPIVQNDPSVSGSGDDVYFVTDDEIADMFFGAPIIVRFASDGSGGAVSYAGVPGATTGLLDPSASADGSRLLFKETFNGVDTVVGLDLAFGVFGEFLIDTTAEHPYLSAEGAEFTFADDGKVFRAAIDFEDPAATSPTPVATFPRRRVTRSSPFWAKPLPPPPPPPPGQISYDGTTVGGPVFQRPEGGGPALANGEFFFDEFAFTTDQTGFYDFLSAQDYDGYLHLYRAPFDPANPLANLVAGNDDFGGTNRQSGFALFLEGQTDFVLVTSSFAPGDAGTFTNTITPRQPPGPGEPPAIEVFTESLRVAAPGEDIEYQFFASSTDAISCVIDFGDGTVEEIANCQAGGFNSATHSFDAEGFFTVTLTVTNAGGSAEAKAFPTIAIDDPNAFNIVVVFANDNLSPSQRAAFTDAAQRWAEIIVNDVGPEVTAGDGVLPADYSCVGEPPFNGFVDDVVISASGEPIDGPGAVLGSAGPCIIRPAGTNGSLLGLPVYGIMRFDLADIENLEADGALRAVILHEMAHVLGIGTLWSGNGFLSGTVAQGADPGDPSYDPRYLAPAGIANYQDLLTDAGFPLEDTVPVANTGGTGTREGHWREATFETELMTGFLSPGFNELSVITVAGLQDLGYVVNFAAADPYVLPGAGAAALQSNSASGAAVVLGHDEVLTFEQLNKRTGRR